MPLYEYICSCGNRFEAIKSIDDRYNATCDCGKIPKLVPSTYILARTAGRFKVFDCDGNLVANKQSTDRTSFKVRKKSGTVVDA